MNKAFADRDLDALRIYCTDHYRISRSFRDIADTLLHKAIDARWLEGLRYLTEELLLVPDRYSMDTAIERDALLIFQYLTRYSPATNVHAYISIMRDRVRFVRYFSEKHPKFLIDTPVNIVDRYASYRTLRILAGLGRTHTVQTGTFGVYLRCKRMGVGVKPYPFVSYNLVLRIYAWDGLWWSKYTLSEEDTGMLQFWWGSRGPSTGKVSLAGLYDGLEGALKRL